MPPPTRNSQMRGRARVEIILPFSLVNFMNSRATITYMAFKSDLIISDIPL
jgi:hypothetical protein